MSLSPVVAYKLRAGLASLAVYLVFALGLGLTVCLAWFPGHLFWLDGGFEGLRLVLVVDLVLGPVLACVIFHPEKSRPKLLFDIVLLALLQFGSMSWGLWQVWQQRPVAMVYGSHRFTTVTPHVMSLQHETAASLRRFSPHRPPLAYRREPATPAETRRYHGMLLVGGFPPEAQAWLFRPYAASLVQVFAHQDAILADLRGRLAAEWAAWAAARGGARAGDYRFAYFEGRYGNALLVFTPAGAPVGYLDLGQRPPLTLGVPPGAVSR